MGYALLNDASLTGRQSGIEAGANRKLDQRCAYPGDAGSDKSSQNVTKISYSDRAVASRH
jgi:hypothetical protein